MLLETEGVRNVNYKDDKDKVHRRIIKLYSDRLSMGTIARHLGLSSKTVLKEIQRHDSSVLTQKTCPVCGKVNSEFQNRIVNRAEINRRFLREQGMKD